MKKEKKFVPNIYQIETIHAMEANKKFLMRKNRRVLIAKKAK